MSEAKAPAVDVAALLGRASLPTGRYRHCVDADLHARWQEATEDVARAEHALERAQKANEPTAAAAGRVAAAREVAEALRLDVEAASLPLVFRALPYAGYNALLKAHPAQTEADKAKVGFDPQGFYTALVRQCLVEPVLTDAEFDQLMAAVTDRQFDALAEVVLRINRREVSAVPFDSGSGTTPS